MIVKLFLKIIILLTNQIILFLIIIDKFTKRLITEKNNLQNRKILLLIHFITYPKILENIYNYMKFNVIKTNKANEKNTKYK